MEHLYQSSEVVSMAREEADREDLMRDATALVERIEFHSPREGRPSVIVGFREDGCASFFFGADLVYQFNSAGELRRGFEDGELLKSRQGILVAMQRHRTNGRVELRSRQFTTEAASDWCVKAAERLREFRSEVEADLWQVASQVPSGDDVLQRVMMWIDGLESVTLAAAPNAR